MHTANADIERPPEAIIERFRGIPTAVLSDVMDDPNSTMRSDIEAMVPKPMTAGAAFTVKTLPTDNLTIHKAISLAQPGDILVIDAEGYGEAGLVGELLATSCRVNQIGGVVIDGAVRDIDDLEKLGFPVFATAVSPKGSSKNHPGSINVPVSCGGIPIHPGHIIVGDSDGVVSITPERAESTLDSAEQKIDDEADLKQRIQSGELIYDIAGFDEIWAQLVER